MASPHSAYPSEAGQPLTLTDVFDSDQLEEYDLPSLLPFLSRPSSLPAEDLDQRVDLAERLLTFARQEEGHHASVRRELQDWATQFRDTAREEIFEGAFNLTPREIAQGTLYRKTGRKSAKSEAVIKWAADQYGDEIIKEKKAAQLEDAQSKWEGAIEDATETLEATQIKENPPAEINGWERIEPKVDYVELAYSGVVDGTPKVVAIYKRESGDLDVYEFLQSEWNNAGSDPRDARMNASIAPTTDGLLLYRELRGFLKQYRAN